MTIPDNLNEDQLARYLTLMIEKMFDKLLEKNPQLKLSLSDEDKKDLAQTIAKTMLNDKDRAEMSREAFEEDPKFMHKLTIALVMTATANSTKHADLSNKLDDIKKLFESKGIKEEKDLQDLEKKLTPAELKQLKEVQQALREFNKDCLDTLKELKLIQPKPEPSGKQPEKEVEEAYNTNVNTLGVLNAKETGSLTAVVQLFLGNLFGTPCQNPNYESSDSQLAIQNKTTDTLFGDSQGLNEVARNNYQTLGIPDIVDTAKDQLQSQLRHEASIRLKAPE